MKNLLRIVTAGAALCIAGSAWAQQKEVMIGAQCDRTGPTQIVGVVICPAQQDLQNAIPNLRLILFGGLIIFFLVVEPEGLNRLWRNIRNYFRVWPFSY